MAHHTRLHQAMDFLHIEVMLDVDEHHDVVKFFHHEMKSLIQQNVLPHSLFVMASDALSPPPNKKAKQNDKNVPNDHESLVGANDDHDPNRFIGLDDDDDFDISHMAMSAS
ncbi:hypothetical protein GUJ93_ZPchr0006g40714 [Zizania palustris]|uniref:Uncharacterized protein n=1 Tax=Zizania palustris TaxID=103762 RepID=A0A8J5SI09_ZIZPA|nr:hypothetical protein GUJ93_ZPchr0006g40714 [Zizania palustris]